MKNLISLLSSIVIAVSASLTTSGTSKKSIDTDAVSTATSKVTYTIQDIINLQDFLLGRPTEENLSEKPYDLTGDGRWDVFDLCLMKRAVFQEVKPEPDSDTLVIYFSRTGNTEKIAEYLIDITNADSYVIEAAVPYTDDDIKYQDDSCRANQEQDDKTVRPEIANPIDSIESYDTIFIGYPIWWGQEPRIIDTFLESYDFSEKTVIPFCTSASSDISTSLKNINALVPIGNQLEGKRFSASAIKEDVKAWYDTLPLNEEESDNKLKISVNGTELTATLEDNSSAKALAELLKQGDITVDMSDYGNFEKVGDLPQSLPKNDEKITTVPGDIILYQGNKITIYYDENTWDFTKLGHIDNITQEELKKLLGDGDVTVSLSIS